MDNWTSGIRIRQLQVILHPVLFQFIPTKFNFKGQKYFNSSVKNIANCMRGLLCVIVAHTRLMRGLYHRKAAHDARPVLLDSRAYCAKDKNIEVGSKFLKFLMNY